MWKERSDTLHTSKKHFSIFIFKVSTYIKLRICQSTTRIKIFKHHLVRVKFRNTLVRTQPKVALRIFKDAVYNISCETIFFLVSCESIFMIIILIEASSIRSEPQVLLRIFVNGEYIDAA